MAAYCCSNHGLSTLLVEKEILPREKCCAGGILQRALGNLDFEVPEKLVEREIRGFTMVHGDNREHFPLSERAGITVVRSKFDEFLARKAEHSGAQLLEGSRVEKIRESGDGVQAIIDGREYRATSLIIAEGVNSRSARKLFKYSFPRSIAVGLTSIVPLKTTPPESIEVHLFGTPTSRPRFRKRFPMNGWLFPLSRGANIGVIGSTNGSELKARMKTLVYEAQTTHGYGGESEWRAHPIPLTPRRKLCTNRCLLVGDAAGLVNQITGEGMSYALESGRLASEAIIRGMQEGGTDFSIYQRWCQDKLMRDLTATKLIGPLIHYLVGVVDTDLFLRNFREESDLVDICLDISRGRQRWTQLLKEVTFRFPQLFFSSIS